MALHRIRLIAETFDWQDGATGETWHFDIDAARRLIARQPADQRRLLEIELAEVAPLIQSGSIAINWDHVFTVDLAQPIIIATVARDEILIIDGWHRIARAPRGAHHAGRRVADRRRDRRLADPASPSRARRLAALVRDTLRAEQPQDR